MANDNGRNSLAYCVTQIVEEFDSGRQAARALRVDPAYLHRLMNGGLVNPSDKILGRLGIERKITFQRVWK